MELNVNIKQETLLKLASIAKEQRDKEQTNENAVEITTNDFWASNIEGTVNFLEVAREVFGANVYYNFNGHNLYSGDVTLDSAYKEITGYTKEEDEAFVKAEIEKIKEERITEANKIDLEDLIQRGQNVVEKGKEEDWESFVRKNEGDSGINLVKNALEVMEAFANGKTMEEAHEIFDSEGHSGFSAKWTLANIEHFCNKGNPDIQEYIKKEQDGEFYKQDFEL